MSISLLRLPTDIPWERICVSDDMLDPRICDKNFPPKWHSSIAVFKFTPPTEYQEFPNHEVIYLKIAVTITGYQPRDAEIEGTIDWGGMSVETIEAVEDLLNEYHPCTGAIVQVAVAPSERGITDPKKFPYFMDFEPKRRELFEMATDTKERMSRSLESLNIGKSASTTQSLEALDIDMGGSWNVGANFTYAGTGGGMNIGSSTQGQWGTKEVGTNQTGVTRTTDQGTERRETSSFTSQITQMYHQLDSYHLGTNRAVFFVQPRPHTLEVPSGFVRGPRSVEGIQEFFMVVAKPKDQKDICVSVRLDTAHLAELPIMEYAYMKDSISLSVSASPPAQNDAQAVADGYDYMNVIDPIFGEKIGERRYKCYRKTVEQVENYTSPWSDYKIDMADSGGYTITSQSASYGSHSVTVQPDGELLVARVWATSRKCYNDGGTVCFDCPDTWHARAANSNLSLVVNLISREAIKQVDTEQVLLVTTRGLCCCGPRVEILKPGVLDAIPMDRIIVTKGSRFGLSDTTIARATRTTPATGARAAGEAAPIPVGSMTIREANALSNAIRAQLIASVAPGRPEGSEPTPFVLHEFFLSKLERRLRPLEKIRKQGQKPVDLLQKMRRQDALKRFFGKPVNEIKSADVGRVTVRELARVAGVGLAKAAELRLAALGVTIKPRDERPEEDDKAKE